MFFARFREEVQNPAGPETRPESEHRPGRPEDGRWSAAGEAEPHPRGGWRAAHGTSGHAPTVRCLRHTSLTILTFPDVRNSFGRLRTLPKVRDQFSMSESFPEVKGDFWMSDDTSGSPRTVLPYVGERSVGLSTVLDVLGKFQMSEDASGRPTLSRTEMSRTENPGA